MEYTDILSTETKKSLDMKDNKIKKVRVQEDSSKNIHRHKYYERFSRQQLHSYEFLTNQEVCDLFGIKPNTLDHWCSDGIIGFSQPTNKRIFLREDITNFINKGRNEAVK